MKRSFPGVTSIALAVLICAQPVAPPRAAAPAEVQGVGFQDAAGLFWDSPAGAETFNVYRNDLAGLPAQPGVCHAHAVELTGFQTPAAPEPGRGWFYLVTAESSVDGEGTPGAGSSGDPRPLLGRCGPVMRDHVLDRTGYGWDEWTADRVAALGLEAYIQEQLDPALIDESDNAALLDALALVEPPLDIFQLIAAQTLRSTYSRRQLEQQYATFWTNHFNTYWAKIVTLLQSVFPPCPGPPSCDPLFPLKAYEVGTLLQHKEAEDFRYLAFNGNFREILEASGMSVAMIVYLDTYTNLAGAPNENFAREELELHSQGVDNGYTQTDIEELARIWSGWTACKKTLANLDDPLAPCIAQYWLDDPAGEWVATFNPGQHDCGPKTLYAGTAQELNIPDTCATPQAGAGDVALALDAIADHPATARFISTKVLQRFVSDHPPPAAVDTLVAVWNDAGNPHGRGDLRAVLEAAVTLDAFLDPDRVRSKIKTPVEHFVSGLRAIRGRTDGVTQILNYMALAQHIPYFNEVPTGYDEVGDAWIDTTNTLERQNYGIHVAYVPGSDFGSDPIGLLQARGVSTAPGNAEAIVAFFADVMFGGALTPAELQVAVDFLNTNALGQPSAYDAVRIRETVGLLMGFPQFQEQ